MSARPPHDVDGLAAQFVAATLPKDAWTHEAHLIVGLWHVERYGAVEALERLRSSIRRLNDAHGTPNSDTRGYHETITTAYVQLLDAFRSRYPVATLEECAGLLLDSPVARPDLLFDYYSRQRLLSVEARRAWVEPDLRPLDPL